MKCIDFDELVQLLKNEKSATLKEEVRHEFGVYRNTVIEIFPHTISIEYIDIAGYQVPLKFLIVNEYNNEIVSLNSVSQLNNIVLSATTKGIH